MINKIKAMSNKMDLTVLLEVNDKSVAEEIQYVLMENGVPSMIKSDNPASSALAMYIGNHVIETISILVTDENVDNALKILENTPYCELYIKE